MKYAAASVNEYVNAQYLCALQSMMALVPNNSTASSSSSNSSHNNLLQLYHHLHQLRHNTPTQHVPLQPSPPSLIQPVHHQEFEFEGEQSLFDSEEDFTNFDKHVQTVNQQVTPSSILSLFEEKTRSMYSFSSSLHYRILFKRLRNRECNKQEANVELSQKYWDPSLDFPVVKGNRYRMLLLFDASRWSPQWNVAFPLTPKLFDAQMHPIDAGAKVLNLARYKDKATSKEGFVLIECCVEFTVLSSRHKGPFTLQVSLDVMNGTPLLAQSSQFNIVSRVAPQRKRDRSQTTTSSSTYSLDDANGTIQGGEVYSPSTSSGSGSPPVSPRSAKRSKNEDDLQSHFFLQEESPLLSLPIIPSSPLGNSFSLSSLLLCE